MKNIEKSSLILVILQVITISCLIYVIRDLKEAKEEISFLHTQLKLTNASLNSQIEEVRKTVIRWAD
jgi:biopolymer transport protein ExbB/TolQ